VNYLAHAYLSFGIPEITVGNLISDFIKGKKKFDYPDRIQAGISLHRSIDSFTDMHPVTRVAKSYFRADYGLYAGPLTDVIYDHFLANDPGIFSVTGTTGAREPVISGNGVQADAGAGLAAQTAAGLAAFAQKTYEQLAAWESVFPERFGRLFPYMRSQNWLYNYRLKEGIYNSLAGLSRRAAYMPGPEQACRLFETHYGELAACYREFFPLLKDFAFQTLEGLEQATGSGKIG
jgi:acyl carrier protein phosphodiesterase